MSFIYLAPNTTYCPDTPENWREFERLKEQLAHGRSISKAPKPRTERQFTEMLRRQVASENKRLRAARAWLPGHGPNKW